MEHEGEKAEPLSLGDVADMKMTLKIWDVPPELGNRFIRTAKGSYANKSWLLLQDLMLKAERYDQMVSSGRLTEIEGKIAALEARLGVIEQVMKDADEALKAAEAQETAEPKTFGKGGEDG